MTAPWPFKTPEAEALRMINEALAKEPYLTGCGVFASETLLRAHQQKCACRPLTPLCVAASADFIGGRRRPQHFPRDPRLVTSWYCNSVHAWLRSLGLFIELFDSKGLYVTHGDFIAAAIGLGVQSRMPVGKAFGPQLRHKISANVSALRQLLSGLRRWARRHPEELARVRREDAMSGGGGK